MSREEFQKTTKRAGIIGISALAGACVGFFLQLLVAYYFGAGASTDAYFMAQSTSDLLGKLLMGGSITAVFIPLFIERITAGKKEDAWDLGLNIVNIMTFVYVIMLGVLWIFSKQFVHFIAPGFTGETYILTVSLLRVLLPSFFFLFLVEFATSMLNSLHNFALPASLRIVAPAVSIVCIALLATTIGIYSLALGVVIGSVIQFAILYWGLRKKGMKYRFFMRLQDPAIRSLAHLVYPFIFSVLTTQGAAIVYRVLVSDLAVGSLSAIKFAEKITQLLTIIFLNSVTLVMYPLLSEKASAHDTDGMRSTIASAMRSIVFVTLPLILAIAVLREPIVAFIYGRGSFSVEDARLTSMALLYLVLGLTTTGISSVLGHTVLALQKTRAAVAITICSQIVAISLFALLTPKMGVAGLALASSLVPLSSALLYFLYARKHIHHLGLIFIHKTYIKTIVLSTISTAGVWVLRDQFSGVLQVAIPLIVGACMYMVLSYVWRIEEAREASQMVRSKFEKLFPL